jgi:L-aspartate oxidase
LVAADGRIVGADLAAARPFPTDAKPLRVCARSVLIASGGAGQVYSETTNPPVATGDGIALALMAGAALADMEFYQFHPTALALPGVPRFLLSEALRGEGAYLRNQRGERFMERYHPLLELAPRDVVARAIAREGMGSSTTGETRPTRAGPAHPGWAHASPAHPSPVYLDMRHVRDLDIHARFPGISAFLAQHGLDLARDLIPVRPAAHYLMGGIKTDLAGRTNLTGLYAAGEAACTGVHGANRLASNSLLEGLVFGARAAQAMLADDLALDGCGVELPPLAALSSSDEAIVESTIVKLRESMWSCAGLLRQQSSLNEGQAAQAACATNLAELAERGRTGRRLVEAQALSSVAGAIIGSALARTESRGAHYRNDYPQRDDEHFRKHSVVHADGRVSFESW